MESSIITLLTDFGLKDPYVAEMKAVVLSLCPNAGIIDISHMIEKFNVRMGAFVLASAAPYFPKSTVHVAVIDPGVGTKRRALLIETEEAFYVGPDNGVLMLAALKQKIKHAYNITNKRFMLSRLSHTFHGRDVFAPAAAHLSRGARPDDFGPEVQDYYVPEFVKPRLGKNELIGEVLHVDDFGNIITNISQVDLEKISTIEGSRPRIRLGKKVAQVRFDMAYGETMVGTAVAITGSHDFLEIAVNQGNAAKRFGAKAGDTVSIRLSK